MIKASLAASLLWLTLATAASSASNCDGSQHEINDCAADRFTASDEALNATYGKLAERIGPKAKMKLATAQKTWAAYREASCDLISAGTEGGSISGMYYNNCMSKMTNHRKKALEVYLDCEEQDLICVGNFVE